MTVVAEPARAVWPLRATLGEGPVWVDDALWFVDIKAPAAHRYAPATGARDTWPMPETIGCLAPTAGGGFVAALRARVARLAFGAPGTTPVIDTLAEPLADAPDYRFNDGKAAPDGSFWFGSMHDPETESGGVWRRMSAGGRITRLADGFAVTNGPAFDVDAGRVYLTDSARRTIFVADWSPGADAVAPRAWRTFEPEHGYPDGMTVDAEGALWVAFWDGGRLRRLDPDGAIMEEVRVPAARPTSVAFGRDRLFVTSAAIGCAPESEDDGEDGALFAITLARDIAPKSTWRVRL